MCYPASWRAPARCRVFGLLLGYGATAPLGTVSGVVPGTITARKPDGTAQYTDGVITASGDQIALMMYEVFMNAQTLITSTREFRLHNQPYQSARGPETLARRIVSARFNAGRSQAFQFNIFLTIH